MFKDQIILITGANRGLGFGLVKQFLQSGAIVIATCRNPVTSSDLKNLKSNYSNNLIIEKLIVDDESSIKTLQTNLNSKINHIDILINNAGVNSKTLSPENPDKLSKLSSLDKDLLLKIFDINAISPMLLTQSLLSFLQKSNKAFVINISSFRASFEDEDYKPNYGYAASKVALNMFTKHLARELKHTNISTFAYDPGWVQTDMNGGEGELTIAEAAERLLKRIESFDGGDNGVFLN
jgi:NAD(P)-dependent dehydrogenase (short-subunit alcohol dehydrogenase family)